MKIISRFKDYYDSVSHQYLDKEIIYKRDEETYKFKDSIAKVNREYISSKENRTYFLYYEYVGFCGQIYPVIQVKYTDQQTGKDVFVGFYTAEDLFEFFNEHKIVIKQERSYRWRMRFYYQITAQDIIDFFKDHTVFAKLGEFFEKYNVPVFVYKKQDGNYHGELIANTKLSSYSFAKVKDPFTAHQDLYRYVTSVMKQPERPMVQITDEDKIAKHGFDKHSFRKMPTKPKKATKPKKKKDEV